MTPTDRPRVEEAPTASSARLAAQLRAIERALDERRDAEGSWTRDEGAGWPEEHEDRRL